MKLELWQQRVIDEIEHLQQRKAELEEFCNLATYRQFDESTRYLISAQWNIMETYERILKTRKAIWEAKGCP